MTPQMGMLTAAEAAALVAAHNALATAHLDDFIAELAKRGSAWHSIPTVSGFSANHAATGGQAHWHFAHNVYTGLAANSRGMGTITLQGFAAGHADGFRFFNYDKKFRWLMRYCISGDLDPEAIARVAIQNGTDAVDLTAKGFGIKVISNALWGMSYGTALGLVNLGVTLVIAVDIKLEIILYPANRIEWWVNDVLVGTQAIAAAIPTGHYIGAPDDRLAHSIVNGATGGINQYSYIIHPKWWQGA